MMVGLSAYLYIIILIEVVKFRLLSIKAIKVNRYKSNVIDGTTLILFDAVLSVDFGTTANFSLVGALALQIWSRHKIILLRVS